jgi:hypothetical protein
MFLVFFSLFTSKDFAEGITYAILIHTFFVCVCIVIAIEIITIFYKTAMIIMAKIKAPRKWDKTFQYGDPMRVRVKLALDEIDEEEDPSDDELVGGLQRENPDLDG